MRSHWPFVMLAAVTLAAGAHELGSDDFWKDGGDTAVVAVSVLQVRTAEGV
jgi:hypothetical protein